MSSEPVPKLKRRREVAASSAVDDLLTRPIRHTYRFGHFEQKRKNGKSFFPPRQKVAFQINMTARRLTDKGAESYLLTSEDINTLNCMVQAFQNDIIKAYSEQKGVAE
jgi:hypothetical protein